MDIAEIEAFLALAEELHFGRTAERLRMPQPRVSRLVSAPQLCRTGRPPLILLGQRPALILSVNALPPVATAG